MFGQNNLGLMIASERTLFGQNNLGLITSSGRAMFGQNNLGLIISSGRAMFGRCRIIRAVVLRSRRMLRAGPRLRAHQQAVLRYRSATFVNRVCLFYKRPWQTQMDFLHRTVDVRMSRKPNLRLRQGYRSGKPASRWIASLRHLGRLGLRASRSGSRRRCGLPESSRRLW